MKRLTPAIATFLLALAVLVPTALTLPQHIIESHYAYISDYYGGRIEALDFSPESGPDERLDPEWNPVTFWTLTQPMGPRYLYAAAMGITQAPPPDLPFIWGDFISYNPLTHLSDRTQNTTRFTSVLLAALGLALIAYRLGWPALAAALPFLMIPHVHDDLARGWAEGPLLFGFGLAAATWGTRWFVLACGLGPLFKLTALPLWLIAPIHGFGGSRFRHVLGLVIPPLVWSALTPPSWYFAGPVYLVAMCLSRFDTFGRQSAEFDPEVWGGLFGHYFPTRYLWPFELAVFLGVAWALSRYWQVRRTQRVEYSPQHGLVSGLERN